MRFYWFLFLTYFALVLQVCTLHFGITMPWLEIVGAYVLITMGWRYFIGALWFCLFFDLGMFRWFPLTMLLTLVCAVQILICRRWFGRGSWVIWNGWAVLVCMATSLVQGLIVLLANLFVFPVNVPMMVWYEIGFIGLLPSLFWLMEWHGKYLDCLNVNEGHRDHAEED